MKNLKTHFWLFAVFMLCSCTTTTFVYNNVDWFINFYLDDYVELDSNQEEILSRSVTKLQSWHRTTELRKYKHDITWLIVHLEAGNLNRDQWLNVFSNAKQHLYNFRDEVSPEAVKLIQKLSDEQINQMLALWAENDNEELEEFTKQAAMEQLSTREEKITDLIEKNIGNLSSQQQSIVNHYSLRIESTFIEDNAYSRRLRETLEPLLVERKTPGFLDRFTSLIKNLDSLKSESLLMANQKNEYLYAELLSELNTSMSKKQRETLLKKLKYHIKTIDSLIE